MQKKSQYFDKKRRNFFISVGVRRIFLTFLAYVFSVYFVFSAFSGLIYLQKSDEGIGCRNDKYLGDFAPTGDGAPHNDHDQVRCCLGLGPSSYLAISADLGPMPEQLVNRIKVTIGWRIKVLTSINYAIYFRSRAPPEAFS
jgi:hypothetical protein